MWQTYCEDAEKLVYGNTSSEGQTSVLPVGRVALSGPGVLEVLSMTAARQTKLLDTAQGMHLIF